MDDDDWYNKYFYNFFELRRLWPFNDDVMTDWFDYIMVTVQEKTTQ